MENYSMVMFLVKHGNAVAVTLSALPFIATICLVFAGYPWLALVIGAVASAIAYLFLKSYVEIVRIIADMLLPK